jgi:hypothetical protein
LNSFFGGSSSSSNNNNTKPDSNQQQPTQRRRVRMMVQDSDVDGQPVICILPIPNTSIATANTSTSTSASLSSVPTDVTPTTAIATIKLRRIDKVQLDGDQIVLYGKIKPQRTKNASSNTSTMAVELLRFSILLNQHDYDDYDSDSNNDERHDTASSIKNQPSNNTIKNEFVFVSTDTRNTMVHYWMVLVEWERQRRLKSKTSSASTTTTNTTSNGTTRVSSAIDDVDSDSEETDDMHHPNSGNFITRHTQRIQHYAQREIELQRTKRQREERKAQLLSQTNGGLKYTALAMATMQSQQQQQ